MKRVVLGIALLLSTAALFAQNDLQPLAVVKLNKSESITLKQLRTRVEVYQKQTQSSSFTVDQKKEILNALIDEKLIVQSAQKEGLSITDSQVNSYFLNSLSQQVGQQVTEQQYADLVKQQTGMSFDDYLLTRVGMNVADYKAYLKNQLIAQQYVISKKQDEMKKISLTDDEVRSFFEMNKASFVQNDMLKIYLVIVPKGSDSVSARASITDIYNKYTKKTTTGDQLKASPDNGKLYQAGDLLVAKTAQHAQQLGMSYQNLLDLFTKNVGFISDISETDTDFQFYAILKKYDAKMLSLSDIVQPDTTVTVYDYIKQNLTQQKQSEFLMQAIQDLTKTLDTPENVTRIKTGDDLTKLLNW
ncbi:MAG: SurA N-terminal domain-containing protein [Treponema sp.]